MPEPRSRHGHVIVCGLDHLGRRTIDELRRRDEEVVAIGPTIRSRGVAGLGRCPVGRRRPARAAAPSSGRGRAGRRRRHDRLRGPRQPQHRPRGPGAQPGSPRRHPDVRYGAGRRTSRTCSRTPSPCRHRRSRPQGSCRQRSTGSRAVDSSLAAGSSSLAHLGGAGPLGQRSMVLAQIDPDRTVDMLPDGDPAEPGLIVVDVLEPGTPDPRSADHPGLGHDDPGGPSSGGVVVP